jgi:putative Holliday junction resolvase
LSSNTASRWSWSAIRCCSRGGGERAHHAERFAAALTGLLEIPVLLQDERLSTVEAERALRQTGASGRDRRRAVDRSAATVILQAWLDTDLSG